MESDNAGGDLQLFDELGRGANTVVYRGRRDGREYAVKRNEPAPLDLQAALLNFRREAAVLASFDDPRTPRVHHVGSSRGVPYLVMDLIEGQLLSEALRLAPMPAARAIQLACDLAGQLAVVHRARLVHRDLKPDNIVLRLDGVAVLIDFSMAATPAAPNATDARGSVAYAAPEQSGRVSRPVDARSDLYSLGVVLFQCVTGRRPFDSANAAELARMHAVTPPPELSLLAPEVGSGLADVVATLLAKDPDDRYQSAVSLLADLDRLVSDPQMALVPRKGRATEAGEPTLVGREVQLAILRAEWESAAAGVGRVCVIRGDSGSGKSRLAQELAREAGSVGDTLVLHSKCNPDEPVPMAAIGKALHSHVRELLASPAGTQHPGLARLRAAAGEAAPLLGIVLPDLRELWDLPVLPGQHRQDQLTSAMSEVLGGLARQYGALLLVLDDVQWIDAHSVKVLRELATVLSSSPVLILATARNAAAYQSGLRVLDDALGAAIKQEIVLVPLNEDQVADVIGDWLPAIATSQLAPILTARSLGSPFVLTEYLRAAVGAGLLYPSWDRWTLDEALTEIVLPRDAISLILGQVQLLGAPCRALLVTAAILGSRFSIGLAARVAGIEPDEALLLASDTANRCLISDAGSGEYTFLHDRIREALLADCPPAQAAEIHEQAAATLHAELARDTAEPHAIYALAEHYLAGTRAHPDLLAQACLMAGRTALAQQAPARAVQLLRHAWTAGVALDSSFLTSFGVALARSGELDQAIVHFEQALALAPDSTARAELLLELAAARRTKWDSRSADAVRAGLTELGSHSGVRLLAIGRTILELLAAMFIAITGRRANLISADRIRRYQIRCSLHEIGAYNAALASQPLAMVAHSVRALYPSARLGFCAQSAMARGALGVTLGGAGLRSGVRAVFSAEHLSRVSGIGDPQLTADAIWHAGAANFLSHIDDGELWEAAIIENTRWLEQGRFDDGVAMLAWNDVLMGRTESAARWVERARERTHAEDNPADMTTWMSIHLHTMTGRFAEARQTLARCAEMVARLNADAGSDEATWSLRTNLDLNFIFCSLNDGDFGPDFDAAVARCEASGLHKRATIRPLRSFAMLRAFGRLSQCVNTEGTERAERIHIAAKAVNDLARVAKDPYLKAFERIAAAQLAILRAEPAKAIDCLGEIRPTAKDAPAIDFHTALTRARALRALNHEPAAIRQAELARLIAWREGWPHRVHAIDVEYLAEHRQDQEVLGTTTTSHNHSEDSFRLHSIQQVSRAASQTIDPAELSRVVLDETIRILSAERAFLFLTDESDQTSALEPFLGRTSDGRDLMTSTGYSASLVEKVRTDGVALVVTGTEDGLVSASASAKLHGLRSMIAAPMLLDGRLMGVVYLDSTVAKGIFTSDDVVMLSDLTNYITTSFVTTRAAALEVSVALARQEQAVTEKLSRAMTQISATHEPERVLAVMRTVAADVLPAERVWTVTSTDDPAQLRVALNRRDHPTAENVIDKPVGFDNWLSTSGPILGSDGKILAQLPGMIGARAESNDADPGVEDSLFRAVGKVLSCSQDSFAMSWLSVPLVSGSQAFGLLAVASSQSDLYGQTQINLAQTLAAQGATAYDNANLLSRVNALANLDELTQLHNRRHFFYVAADSLHANRHSGRQVAGAMVDIDHFKTINDTYGHAVGDQVIRAVAERLSGNVRTEDVLGRYGGEEFALVLPAVRAEDLAGVADHLRRSVADQPIDTTAGRLRVTVSVGAATCISETDDVAGLLDRADAALYRAKDAGRNCVRIAA